MPFLSRFAAEAVFYERAYAPTSWTLPSIASLFTAQYPSQHRVTWWQQPIQTTEATLAGVLRSKGYVTGGFSAHAAIGPEHALDQGFTTFQVVGKPRILRPPDATEVNAAALAWITSVAEETAPYFLYLHYMDVHAPYRPHEAFTGPRETGVTSSDAQLSQNASKGAFASESERSQLWDFSSADQRRLQQMQGMGRGFLIGDAIGRYLSALAKEDKTISAIPVFNNVQPFIDFPSESLRTQVPA